LPTHAPPTEFLIWPFGEIATTKGTFLFDDSAAQSVLDSWQAYGNRLTIDYEHKAVDPNRRAGDGRSAGSFLLELRDDGLYAIDVRWTPPAFEQLSNKEWLYFSPYFSAEEDSGRILELINLALTNIPATRNMTPLVAAHRSTSSMDDDINTEINAALAEGEDPPPSDDEKAAAKKAAKERMAKLRAALAEAEKEFASLAGEDDTSDGPSNEEEETLGDAEDERSPAKATSAIPRATPAAASRIVAAASVATGKSDPAEIVGALTALGRTRAANVSLSKRVADLERKLQRGEVERLVVHAIKTGKLTPAEREWALSYGMQSLKELRAYLDVTPQRAVVVGSEPREPRVTAGQQIALSDVERKICANAGIDPAKFAEVRNRPIRFTEGGD
jgi:phage I-like protein